MIVSPTGPLPASPYDVCVLGGGIAGIVFCLELAEIRPDLRICLVESGGEKPDQQHQAMCQGELRSTALDSSEDPAVSRLRGLGGGSHYWGGYLSPLDAESFEHKEWQPGSGWPITRQDLDPWYAIAAPYFGIEPSFELTRWFGDTQRVADFRASGLTQKIFQIQALNFSTVYRGTLDSSSQVDVYLETTGVGLGVDRNGRISVARCVRGGEELQIGAERFVVAMGGLENARFLLNAREASADLLPVTHRNTGRYFSVHPVFAWGKALLAGSLAESGLYGGAPTRTSAGGAAQAFLKLPPEVRRQRGWFDSFFDLALPTAAEQSRVLDTPIIGHLTARPHVLMGVAGIVNEMQPRHENHVGLADSRDALGQRRLYISLRLSDQELRSGHEQFLYLGEQLGANGMGRLWLDRDLIDRTLRGEAGFTGGHHHMCTTRMSRTPEDGVVDADCRFHDHENLYAIGASVFSSSGSANPTFTIGALAIRLAHHLGGTGGGGQGVTSR